MEKYGVACRCTEGQPDAKDLIKLADGARQCAQCGRVFKLETLKLADVVKLEEKK